MLVKNMPRVRRIARVNAIWDLIPFYLIATYVEKRSSRTDYPAPVMIRSRYEITCLLSLLQNVQFEKNNEPSY